MAKLLYDNNKEFIFNKGQSWTIGRSDNCTIFLNSPTVSRSHCIITKTEDGRFVIDDSSRSSGTFINGSQISECQFLKNGDVLKVGDCLLTFYETSNSHWNLVIWSIGCACAVTLLCYLAVLGYNYNKYSQHCSNAEEAEKCGNYGKAVEQYRLALAVTGYSGSTATRDSLTSVELKQGNFDKFSQNMKQGKQQIDAGNWDNATNFYQQALAIEGYETNRDAMDCLKLCEQNRKKFFEFKYEKLIQTGNLLMLERKYEEAAKTFEKALAVNGYANDKLAADKLILAKSNINLKNKFDALVADGDVAMRNNDYGKAIEYFKEARQIEGFENDLSAISKLSDANMKLNENEMRKKNDELDQTLKVAKEQQRKMSEETERKSKELEEKIAEAKNAKNEAIEASQKIEEQRSGAEANKRAAELKIKHLEAQINDIETEIRRPSNVFKRSTGPDIYRGQVATEEYRKQQLKERLDAYKDELCKAKIERDVCRDNLNELDAKLKEKRKMPRVSDVSH